MKEDKYYTPDISEFHVGFEYEEREFIYTDKGWYTSKVNGFVPKVFQGDDYIESYYLTERVKRKLYNDSIRVKYLDKEDIESLGFVYKGLGRSSIISSDTNGEEIKESGFSKDLKDGSFCHIRCFLNKENRVISTITSIEVTDIFEDENSSPFSHYREGGSGGFISHMIVKNKSELKRLLKQLGVITKSNIDE